MVKKAPSRSGRENAGRPSPIDSKKFEHNPASGSGSNYRSAKGPPEINFPDSLESHRTIADLRNGTSISVSRELLGQVSPSFEFEHKCIPWISCCLRLLTVRLLCLGHLLRLPSYPLCQRTEEDLNGSIPPNLLA